MCYETMGPKVHLYIFISNSQGGKHVNVDAQHPFSSEKHVFYSIWRASTWTGRVNIIGKYFNPINPHSFLIIQSKNNDMIFKTDSNSMQVVIKVSKLVCQENDCYMWQLVHNHSLKKYHITYEFKIFFITTWTTPLCNSECKCLFRNELRSVMPCKDNEATSFMKSDSNSYAQKVSEKIFFCLWN